VPEGVRVLERGRKFGIAFKWDEFPWSCEYRLKRAKSGSCMTPGGARWSGTRQAGETVLSRVAALERLAGKALRQRRRGARGSP